MAGGRTRVVEGPVCFQFLRPQTIVLIEVIMRHDRVPSKVPSALHKGYRIGM